jgi:hypothetical protein
VSVALVSAEDIPQIQEVGEQGCLKEPKISKNRETNASGSGRCMQEPGGPFFGLLSDVWNRSNASARALNSSASGWGTGRNGWRCCSCAVCSGDADHAGIRLRTPTSRILTQQTASIMPSKTRSPKSNRLDTDHSTRPAAPGLDRASALSQFRNCWSSFKSSFIYCFPRKFGLLIVYSLSKVNVWCLNGPHHRSPWKWPKTGGIDGVISVLFDDQFCSYSGHLAPDTIVV